MTRSARDARPGLPCRIGSDRRSTAMVLAEIAKIDEQLKDPALNAFHVTLLQGAKISLRWSLGLESIIPHRLAERHAQQSGSAAHA